MKKDIPKKLRVWTQDCLIDKKDVRRYNKTLVKVKQMYNNDN